MSFGRCLLVVLLLALDWPMAKAQDGPQDSFVVSNVRLFDGERVQERRTVIVVGGVIEQVGGPNLRADALPIVDGEGRTLLPGFIDSHVHLPAFGTDAALSQNTRFGVTTVIDMFSAGITLDVIRDFKAQDDPQHASIVMSGTGATATGGHPSQMGNVDFPMIDEPQRAQEFVNARVSEGSEFLKVIYDDLAARQVVPMLDRETLTALVEAAHSGGLLAIAHVSTEAQARDVIEAGVDGLAHLFNTDDVSADFGAVAARHDIFVIPTLSVVHLICGRSDGPGLVADERIAPYIAAPWRENAGYSFEGGLSCDAIGSMIRQLVDAGVPILAGTDSPTPGTTYGASVHTEVADMVEHGMVPIEALVSATSAPARAFGLNDRGLIRPGMRADLVLVEGDPTETITDTRNIVAVWKRGVAIERQQFE